MTTICHLTSAHPRYDTRIFQRMCKYISKEGFTTYLVVGDGMEDCEKDGVKIFSIPKSKNRFSRMLLSPYKILQKSLKLNADIYHLHDPELLPLIPLLKLRGKKVIFDFHEDFIEQIPDKEYLNKYLAKVIRIIFIFLEKLIIPMLDGVVTATPFINKKYLKLNRNSININNFPEISLIEDSINKIKKGNNICYVGVITKERGILEILTALDSMKDNIFLELAGVFSDKKIEQDSRKHPGWKKVIFHGKVSYKDVPAILARSIAGIVVFHPISNHINSQPNKIFEYMASGIPIIASDFPLWKEIIKKNNIGYHVNPLKPIEISAAIKEATYNNEYNKAISKNAKNLIKYKYNWEVEFFNLAKMYNEL